MKLLSRMLISLMLISLICTGFATAEYSSYEAAYEAALKVAKSAVSDNSLEGIGLDNTDRSVIQIKEGYVRRGLLSFYQEELPTVNELKEQKKGFYFIAYKDGEPVTSIDIINENENMELLSIGGITPEVAQRIKAYKAISTNPDNIAIIGNGMNENYIYGETIYGNMAMRSTPPIGGKYSETALNFQSPLSKQDNPELFLISQADFSKILQAHAKDVRSDNPYSMMGGSIIDVPLEDLNQPKAVPTENEKQITDNKANNMFWIYIAGGVIILLSALFFIRYKYNKNKMFH